MILKMNYISCALLAVFLTCLNFGTAAGQSVTDHVEIVPPANWVEVQPDPTGEYEAAARLKVAYRVASYQDRVTKTEHDRYRRFVVDLLTSGGVEENGTLSISFDPEYQDVDFHHLNVVRDGAVTEKLDLSAFEIFRSETERENLIYNGQLTLNINLEGLKVGDRLDYAYTRSGKNTALGDGFFDVQTQEFSTPMERFYYSFRIEDGLPFHMLTHNGATQPDIIEENSDVTILRHTRNNVPIFNRDDNVPNWQYSAPTLEVSSYDNWEAIGEVFAPNYRPGDLNSVRAIVDKIRAENDTAEKQARAALDYIQEEIRYLGLEMGVGGYIPRTPELVLERRFGDCKDVTLLLLTILHHLGISADAMLVDTEELAGVFTSLPSHTAFDHVVVIAEIAGKSYVLDATNLPQLGDIEHFSQGFYGKGLRLRENGSEVVILQDRLPEWQKDITDRFDLVSDPETVTFTNTLRYYGANADSTVEWVNDDGIAAVEKVILDFFRDSYPKLEVSKPTELILDQEKAVATLVTVFNIPDAWVYDEEDERDTFLAYPDEVGATFPDFDGADRVTHFSLSYPQRVRQTLEFVVDDTYSFDDDMHKIESDAFDYTEVNRWDSDAKIYRETYSYRTKQDHIKLENVKSVMAEIDEANDRMGLYVYRGDASFELSDILGDLDVSGPLRGLISLLLLAGIGFFIRWTFRKA